MPDHCHVIRVTDRTAIESYAENRPRIAYVKRNMKRTAATAT